MYARWAQCECVAIEMQWMKRGAVGILHIPDTVARLTSGTDYGRIKDGESLILPIALGYGVILSTLTHVDLLLTGDKTAWEPSWGALMDVSGSVPTATYAGMV